MTLSEELSAYGLTLDKINAIEAAIQCDQHNPSQAWKNIITILNKNNYSFNVHKLIYDTIFTTPKPYPIWTPTPDILAEANVTTFMQLVGKQDYDELHRWSNQSYSEFWQQAINTVGIRFKKNPTQIVDVSGGIYEPQWFKDAELNIADNCFNADPYATAIISQDPQGDLEKISYLELDKLSNRVANSLLQWVKPGDAIAIILPMTIPAIALYLGIIKAGCVVVSIAESFANDEISTRLMISKAKMVFTQDVLVRDYKRIYLYEKVVKDHAPVTVVLSKEQTTIKLRLGDLRWDNFLVANESFTSASCTPHSPTNILFSSGTTGDPKAILWDHTTPMKCATDAYFYQNIKPGDRLCWPTSLGWMMGPWLIYASLINKATILLYEGLLYDRSFGEFIQDQRVTMLGLVPSLVRHWRQSGCMEGFDWRSIKVFSSSGECSNPDDMLYLMWLARYKPIIEYCGGTEIGGAYLTSVVVKPNIPGYFNTFALGTDGLIIDEQGHLANKGECFLRVPSIGFSTTLLNKNHFHVYFANTPQVTDYAMVRRHGDELEKTEDGYYRILGRVDDTMNLSGVKTSAAELENVINNLSFIKESAAIAINIHSGPSQLVIYLVTNQTDISKDDLKIMLQNTIKEHLNPLFRIYDLCIVNKLPRTATNKIMRRILRDEYQLANRISD